MITTILSLSIFILYLVFVLRYIKGIPPKSLSETFYLLPEGIKQYLFTAMMWAIAFLLIIPMMDITPAPRQFLVFFLLGSIILVGSAPMFKSDFEGKVHTVGACIAALFGILWSLLCTEAGPYVLVVSLFGALIIALLSGSAVRSRIFWLEMVAFSTVYLSTISELLP